MGAQRPDTTGSDRSQSSGGGGGSSSSDPRVGTYFLGRYRVVDEIGIGGMASVHLARMDGPGGFQKWVAIKRIHGHLIEDDSFVQMFLDEARVAARISHPNVASVFELGKHDDNYWIAMEYLHGEPLREVMRRTEEIGAPMPPEIACRVIADAAEGLHAAHELLGKNGEKLGLIHRDVTPHNLFVTYDGTTKVVDFGIAKFSSRMSQTRAGTLKGKLAYMSPEQVHGEQIDRRTDIFALGVVLWELTTGQRLFRMESDLDTLAKVQECNVPRPSTLVRGYPIDLEKIVMKALSKNRGERFKTAREFSRALQSLLMRRGLFIASDEVASYIQSIFSERIQKREAHLRWAAEVTQTISLESALGASDQSALLAFNAELHNPASLKGGPRPAAGAPPPGRGSVSQMPVSQSNPSMGAPMRADTFRPPARSGGNFGESPSFDSSYDDGPTIQGASQAEFSTDEDFDDNDDTIVTTTRVEPSSGKGLAAPRPAAGAPAANNGPFFPHETGETRAATPAARSGPFTPAVDPYQAEPETVMQGGGPVNPFASTAQATDPLQFGLVPRTVSGSLAPPELPFDNRTVTARALKKGLPPWAVAVASGVAALVFVGLIWIVLSLAVGSSKPQPVASPSTSASAGTGAPLVPGSGPFGSARAAFSAVLVPPPPPPPPAPTASAAMPSEPTPVDTTPPPTPTPAPAPTHTAVAAAAPTPVHAAPTPVARPARGPSGMLTVICKPGPCDQVIDNGKSLGASPIFRAQVPVGEHRLQLKSASGMKVVPVIVVADELKVVSVSIP